MSESTSTTYLGYAEIPSSGSAVPTSFTKVCDITDYPDLSSPAERIETTTLSDKKRTYIKGLEDTTEQTYGANYDKAQYKAVKAFGDDQKYWGILFEDSASFFYFKGQSHISVAGAGLNEVRKMNITLYPNTEIELYEGTGAYDETTGNITLTAQSS